MIDPRSTLTVLAANGVRFFTGVPDSLLKDFCAHVEVAVDPARHVIAANEGAAVALAAGHHLATGEIGLVYMQNSGLGNAVNPLLSLADDAVYAIPMLLLIGWRGEPGRHDEPQHVKQGDVTLPMLAAMGIEALVLPETDAEAETLLRGAVDAARRRSAPVAIVVRAGTFERVPARPRANAYALSREEAIGRIVDALPADAAVVSTTGMSSRELFEHRVARGLGPERDFLTVGSMGHASQIALAIALAQPERQVVCLDGDGAVLMHMGALALIGSRKPTRFLHVVLNNGTHDSVGGQATVGYEVDLVAVARACGYAAALRVEDIDDLSAAVAGAIRAPGPALLEVRIHPGARADLGRPTSTPGQNKQAFMAHLRRHKVDG